MATTQPTRQPRRGSYTDRPSPSGLADVVDLILDKGLVIDAYVRVSLVGIELLTIDARVVVASVDTYLRFAEATNRLDLGTAEGRDLPELTEDLAQGATESGSKGKAKGALDAAGEKIEETLGRGGTEEEPEERERRPRRRGENR